MAAATAWEDDDHVLRFQEKYKENFQIAKEALDVTIPEATFYLWMEVGDELAFTRDLYAQYHVKVLPGSFLGRNGVGQGFVRIALVETPEKTLEAVRRLKNFLGR
jgi:aspartate/methionine/tyrosine aminotransferase